MFESMSPVSSKLSSSLHSPSTPTYGERIPAHNVFVFDQVIFSSNLDNGNLAKVEKVPNRSYEYKIWTAPDNMVTFEFSFILNCSF